MARILCRKVGNYIFFLNLLLKDLWQLYIKTTVCKIHKSQHIQGRFRGMFCIGELGLNQNDDFLLYIWILNMLTPYVTRDIKCANILVDASGLVKLADFGLAKEVFTTTF